MPQAETIAVSCPDGRQLRAYLAQPALGSGPGLLLVHGEQGLNEFMRETADRLAEEGYVCLVPDLFARLNSGLDSGDGAAGATRPQTSHKPFDDALGVADLTASATTLRGLPSYRGKLGFIGWGSGGRLAVLAAAGHPADCVVSYASTDLQHLGEKLVRLTYPVLVQLGEADTHQPAAARLALTAACAGQAHIEIHTYPACGHNFSDRFHSDYNKPAAMMAYSRTIALLRRELGPIYDLSRLWDAHTFHEFGSRDVDATMATMVAQPYVNHIPTMTGGVGHEHLRRFYTNHFVNSNPPDTRLIPVSRTVGADRLVDEMVFCFTHTCEIPWMLPGVAPTGRYVEIPLVAIVNFRGEKLYHEHIYWDQASVLVQIGVLDPCGLPVAGIATAKKLIDETLPSNELMGTAWDRR